MTPALIIFDLDGVLVDSELLSARAISELLAEHGVAITVAEVAARFTGLTDREIGDWVARESGRPIPGDFAARAERRTLELFDGALQPIPGAHELLRAIALPVCVASNSPPQRVARSLSAAGLSAHFPEGTFFSAAAVARPKPAPDVFLHAAEMMGAAPGECLVVEDSPTGVRAAVAAGMTVHGFVGAGHVTDREALGATLTAAGAAEILSALAELRLGA